MAGAASGVLVLAAGLVVWRDREALGARLAVDALRRRGIPATVRITRLDPGGVEGALAIGPPGDPDLTVERFRAEFAPWAATGGGGAPRLTRLVLTHPHLRARWDGRRLQVGALQPLLDSALHASPGAGPGPRVEIDGGVLDLATPYGPARAWGDLRLAEGRLAQADVELTAAALEGPHGLRGEALRARLYAQAEEGERVRLRIVAQARAASGAGVALRAPELTASADLPYGRDARRGLDGRVVVTAWLRAGAARGRGAVAQDARAQGRVDGVLDRGGEHAVGALRFELAAARLAAGASSLNRATLTLASDALDAFAARGAPAVRGPVGLALSVAGGATPVAGGRLRLGAARAAGAGRLTYGRGLRLEGAASLSGVGGLDAAAAARLAQTLSPGEGGAAGRAALAQAAGEVAVSVPRLAVSLRDDAWRVALQAPASASARGGARLVVTRAQAARAGEEAVRGELTAALAGGGLPDVRLAAPQIELREAGGGVRATAADLRLTVAGSLGPLRDARLAFSGRVSAGPHGMSAVANGCTPLAVAAVAGDAAAPLAEHVALRAYPDGASPLLTIDTGGWRLATRVEALNLGLPAAKLTLADASGRLRLNGHLGGLGGLGGQASLAAATVRDTAAPRRFQALAVSGPVSLADGAVTARLAVALANGRTPLGPLRLVQRLDGGESGLTLQVPALAFAPDGLQPAALVPALAPFAREVRGAASGELTLAWGPAGARGAARVRTAGLDLVTAAGPVKGLATDLNITSLDPLLTAPDQELRADRLEALLPLTDLHAVVTLAPGALRLAQASAELAGGRVSLDAMAVPLTAGSTLSGVVRAKDVRLGALLDTVNLSRALKVDARLQGALPFSLGPAGLRFTHGELSAEGPGRLTLERSALTGVSAAGGPAGAPPSAAQDFAFKALEDLAFSELGATVDSLPAGRLGVVLHVKGRHDPPTAPPARVGLLDLLRGRAFSKEIPLPKGTQVDLTLDTSLNFDDLYRTWLGLGRGAGGSGAVPTPAAPPPGAASSAGVQP